MAESEWREKITNILCEQRHTVWPSERRDIERRLIRPCLAALGWYLGPGSTQVRIGLGEEEAARWGCGYLVRDFVLPSKTDQVLHMEAKRSWGTTASEVEALLERFNRDDWRGTEGDGWEKDLALLLWGAHQGGAHRAALMDENRLLVFDWEEGWRLAAEARVFDDPPDHLFEALRLLEPAAFTRRT